MRGVFSAGVAKSLQDNNFYPHITAIYGASAGVMTGAYFLARQTELGASIYWENLGTGFISARRFYVGVWQRFKNRFIRTTPSEKIKDAIDINYLIRVVKEIKPLKIEDLVNQPIPLYVKLFNLGNHNIEYVDTRRGDALDLLKAGVNVFPYVHEVSVIDGKRYIDAAIMDIVGFEALRKRHPTEKIIIVMNGNIDRKFRYKLKNMLEGKFMEWMFNDPKLYPLYANAEDRLLEDLRMIAGDSNCVLVTDDHSARVRSRTTDKNRLLNTYKLGIAAGEQLLRKELGLNPSNN